MLSDQNRAGPRRACIERVRSIRRSCQRGWESKTFGFSGDLLAKPAARGLAVETTLRHFAIVTYWVDPSSLRKHLHPRFEPQTLTAGGHAARSLISDQMKGLRPLRRRR
jgi:hypothetical protein